MKTLKRLTSIRPRAIIGAILMAAALWVYASMNNEYTSVVVLPLMVNPPAGRAIENTLPGTISVEVKSNGWQLMNLNFFSNRGECYVDMTKLDNGDSVILLTRNDIFKSLPSLRNAQALDVFPQSIPVKTGKIGEYSVPVISQVTIIPKDGFILVGKPELKPDLINISGNDRLVRKIKTWSTELLVLKNVYESISSQINLSDSLKNTVTLSNKNIRFTAEIQQEAEMTFYDIKLKFKGGSLPNNNSILPGIVNVTVKGGIGNISALSHDNISAIINIDDLLKDSTGIVIPEIEVPSNVKVTKISPPYLYHQKTISTVKGLALK